MAGLDGWFGDWGPLQVGTANSNPATHQSTWITWTHLGLGSRLPGGGEPQRGQPGGHRLDLPVLPHQGAEPGPGAQVGHPRRGWGGGGGAGCFGLGLGERVGVEARWQLWFEAKLGICTLVQDFTSCVFPVGPKTQADGCYVVRVSDPAVTPEGNNPFWHSIERHRWVPALQTQMVLGSAPEQHEVCIMESRVFATCTPKHNHPRASGTLVFQPTGQKAKRPEPAAAPSSREPENRRPGAIVFRLVFVLAGVWLLEHMHSIFAASRVFGVVLGVFFCFVEFCCVWWYLFFLVLAAEMIFSAGLSFVRCLVPQ